VLKIKNSKIK